MLIMQTLISVLSQSALQDKSNQLHYIIKDGGSSGTAIATFDTPIGGASVTQPTYYQIDMPGQGLHCATSGYATLTNVAKVTILYG